MTREISLFACFPFFYFVPTARLLARKWAVCLICVIMAKKESTGGMHHERDGV